MKISSGYQAATAPESFAEAAITATDTAKICNVNFANTGHATTWAGIAVDDHFAVEITGYIIIPAPGAYTFSLTSDDGSRLYIEGTEVIDHSGLHGNTEREGTISLTAGKHKFRVEYFEYTGSQTLIAQIAGPGMAKQVIPTEMFTDEPPCMLNMDVSHNYRTARTFASFQAVGLTADVSTSVCNIDFPRSSGNHSWGGVSFSDYVAVEITGFLEIETAGDYHFCLTSDDGSLLFINDLRVVNDEGLHGMSEQCNTGPVNLAAGRVPMRLTFFEHTGYAGLILKWSGPGIAKQVIPATAFKSRGSVQLTYPVRLVEGSDMNAAQGRLEVLYNGQWGSVCDDGFSMADASVACRQMGFGTAMRKGTVSHSERGSGPIWMDDVVCTGNETALSDCQQVGWGQSNCGHSEDTWVQCGNVRLSGGENDMEGLLQVYHNGEWGTVCDDSFNKVDGDVVCHQLGMGMSTWVGTKLRDEYASFVDSSTTPIWMDDVQCHGTEASLEQCPYGGWGVNNCQHSEDVALSCGGTSQQPHRALRLVPTGTSDYSVTFTKKNKTHCYDDIGPIHYATLEDAEEACKYSGSCFGVYDQYCDGLSGTTGYRLCGRDVDRFGSTSFSSCVYQKHSTGTAPLSGRLEVLYEGGWGTVCDDGFSEQQGQVACRQLGLGTFVDNDNVAGTGQIWLDDVQCQGTENALSNCQHRPWGSNNCAHTEDVSLTCAAATPPPPSPTPNPSPTPTPTPSPTTPPTPGVTPPVSPTPTPTPTPTPPACTPLPISEIQTSLYVDFKIRLEGIAVDDYQALQSTDIKVRTTVAAHAGNNCGAGCSPCEFQDITTLGVTAGRRAGDGVQVEMALKVPSTDRERMAETTLKTYLATPGFQADIQIGGNALGQVSSSSLVQESMKVMTTLPGNTPAPPVTPSSQSSGGGGNGTAVALSVICGLLLAALIGAGIYFMHYKNKDSLAAQMAAVQGTDLELDQDSVTIPSQGTYANVYSPTGGMQLNEMGSTPPSYKYDDDHDEDASLTKHSDE